jgi:hypothetical protein
LQTLVPLNVTLPDAVEPPAACLASADADGAAAGADDNAFAVLVSSPDFVRAALAMLESARRTCTRAHLVVLLLTSLPAVTETAFLRMGFAVARVEPISNPHPERMVVKRQLLNYSKLRAWLLTRYKTVIVLDADMVLTKNVDELFETQAAHALSAVANYDSLFSNALAREGALTRIFNSGLMVIHPALETYAKLAGAVATTESYNGGDQGFLNLMFPDWHELPLRYNVNRMLLGPLAAKDAARLGLDVPDAAVLHLTREKPWLPYEKQVSLMRQAAEKLPANSTARAAALAGVPEDYEFAHAAWRAADEAARLRLHGVLGADDLAAYGTGGPSGVFVGWTPRLEMLQRQFNTQVCIPGRDDPGCYDVLPFFCAPGEARCAGAPSGAAAARAPTTDADTTVVTQMSASKLSRLVKLAAEWGGPVSAAFYVAGGNHELDAAIALLRATPLPSSVVLHLVVGRRTDDVYPINLLRTVAQRGARTHLVLMLDVDFHVTHHLHASLQAANPAVLAATGREALNVSDVSTYAHVWANAAKRHAFVLPAFQLNMRAPCSASDPPATGRTKMVLSLTPAGSRCIPLPTGKRAIAAAVEKGWADVFHSTMRAHAPTDTRRWLDSEAPYYVRWAGWYEPYVLVNASLAETPEYDMRFVDRGVNKVIWMHVLSLRGFRFVVLPRPFVLHAWETPGREHSTRRGMFRDRTTLYASIVAAEEKAAEARRKRAGGDGSDAAPELLELYEPFHEPEEQWRPARATLTRSVKQRKENPRLRVSFDAWDAAALDTALANATALLVAAAAATAKGA